MEERERVVLWREGEREKMEKGKELFSDEDGDEKIRPKEREEEGEE